MILCSLSQVAPGAILGSIVTDPHHPDHDLLRPGVTLDAPMIASLEQRGVTQLWIEDDLTADLDAAVAPQLAASRTQVYTSLRNGLAACARSTINSSAIHTYRAAIVHMVSEALGSARYASMTDDLFNATGQASHGTNVAYLSLICGLHIEQYVASEQPRLSPRDAREMSVLGLAGMLHDIGKTRLDPKDAAFREVHSDAAGGPSPCPEHYPDHVALGRKLLENSRAPARVTHAVLNHHQRFDGRGWPDMKRHTAGRISGPLAGRRIHIFARIVAAANVLDNLLRDADGARRPPVVALYEFASPRFDGWFDPIVRRAMLMHVPPFAIGTEVTLSDARRAVVISPTPEDPCRPVVRIIPARPPTHGPPAIVNIDLHTTPELSITHSMGVDVAGYIFKPPPLPTAEPARRRG